MDKDTLVLLLMQAYGQPQAFFRDTNLTSKIAAKYQQNIFLREPTFCDATYKLGGLLGTHRFQIISAYGRCIDELSTHPEWGLCIWKPNTLFKIIDVTENIGKTQITLLDVPPVLLPFFSSPRSATIEEMFAQQARECFTEALALTILPELNSSEWRERVAHPIGLDDNGDAYNIEIDEFHSRLLEEN